MFNTKPMRVTSADIVSPQSSSNSITLAPYKLAIYNYLATVVHDIKLPFGAELTLDQIKAARPLLYTPEADGYHEIVMLEFGYHSYTLRTALFIATIEFELPKFNSFHSVTHQ